MQNRLYRRRCLWRGDTTNILLKGGNRHNIMTNVAYGNGMGRTFSTHAPASFCAGSRIHGSNLLVSGFAGQSANQYDLIFDSVSQYISLWIFSLFWQRISHYSCLSRTHWVGEWFSWCIILCQSVSDSVTLIVSLWLSQCFYFSVYDSFTCFSVCDSFIMLAFQLVT